MNDDIDLIIDSDSEISLAFDDDAGIDIDIEPNTGTKDYTKLRNKPSIEQHILVGDSSLEDIGVEELTAAQTAALLT